MMPQLDFYMFFIFAAAVSISFIFFSYLATEFVCIIMLIQKGRRYNFNKQYRNESVTYSTIETEQKKKGRFFSITEGFIFYLIIWLKQIYNILLVKKKRRYNFNKQYRNESVKYSTQNKKKKTFNWFSSIKNFFFSVIKFIIFYIITSIFLYGFYIYKKFNPEINIDANLPYSQKFGYIDEIFKRKKEIISIKKTDPNEYTALVNVAIRILDGLSRSCFGSPTLQGILYKIVPKQFIKYVSFTSAPSKNTPFTQRFLYYLTYCSSAFMGSSDLTEEITTHDSELTAEAEAREKVRRIVGESLTDAMLQNSKNKPDAFFKPYVSYKEEIDDIKNSKNLTKLCLEKR
jgi:hypothetical protein